MARRKNPSMDWQLALADPSAVANARIALALMRAARRVPNSAGAFDPAEAGRALAPVVDLEPRLWQSTMKAHGAIVTARDFRLDEESPATTADPYPLDRDAFETLGNALMRGTPAFDTLFARMRQRLEDFTADAAHPSDRNLAILAERLALNAPEAAYLQLAAAHAYSAIDRGVFRFVDAPLRLLKAAEAITGESGAPVARIFHRDGPLVTSGLFDGLCPENGGRDLEDKLRLSTLGDRLLGVPIADERQMAEIVLRRLPAPRQVLAWPHLAQPAAMLREALRRGLAQGRPGLNILLHGAPGTGKTEFARQLLAEIGVDGFAVAHMDEDGGEATRAERLQALRLCQTFAGEAGRAVLVLDEAEDIFQDNYNHPLAGLFSRGGRSKAWMNALLEGNEHPVVWISNRIAHLDPAYLRRFTFCLEFPESPLQVRREVAGAALAPLGCSERFIDAVARQEGFSPALLANAAAFAQLCGTDGAPQEDAVRTALTQHARAAGRPPMLSPRPPATRFDLRYLNVRGESTPQGVINALSTGEPAALLLSGLPGTGKTAFAGALATQLGRRLVVRTASDINGMFHGESERNVARLFESCDPACEVLFVDEADVLLGAREAASHRVDRAVTAEFLRWLEAFEGVFACATNHAGDFDAALMRRFTFRMEFRALSAQQRNDLFAEQALGWSGQAGEPPLLDRPTQAALAGLDQLTAGDFANVARRLRLLRTESPATWLRELAVEHDHKRPGRTQSMGFV